MKNKVFHHDEKNKIFLFQHKKIRMINRNQIIVNLLECSRELLGCSSRLRFLFLWHRRNTAIITILIIPKPRPMTTYSFISDSWTPGNNKKMCFIIVCYDNYIWGKFISFMFYKGLQNACFSSDWSLFPCSSCPQLCWPLHTRSGEIQNLECSHLNISGGHGAPLSFTSVHVALNPLAPTDFSAMKNL